MTELNPKIIASMLKEVCDGYIITNELLILLDCNIDELYDTVRKLHNKNKGRYASQVRT